MQEHTFTDAAVTAPANAANLPDRVKLMVFGLMAFGQFMALLDIQIVAGSLNAIQAGLSAGPDEIAWVQTAYLMAEIVMIPLAAFLSQAISTRWLFAGSAALFTVASLMCGFAWDIDSMIVFRALQGFVGGVMVPLVFATGFTMFDGPRRALVPAILGVVSTLAPTLGPTVGGLITDIADWRWLFFINVIPGLAITILLPMMGKLDEADPSMLKRIDWTHVGSLALFLGAFQYMLEEGPRHEWFTDVNVTTAAWLSFVGAVVFFERSFFSPNPVIRLSPFKRPTFAMACALNLVIGFGLYGATYLTPVFLGRIEGYSSLQIGITVFVTGIFMFCGAPIAARLSTRIDQRIVITVGFSLFALGLWMMTQLTADWGFWNFFLPQGVRGFATLLCIVPSVGMALNGVAPTELRYASGLFNLSRNMGGAVGIAVTTTWLGDFARLHALRLTEGMSASPARSEEVFAQLARMFSATTSDATHAVALVQGEVARVIGREALTLAFNDVYHLMACLFLVGLLLVPFARAEPVEPASAGAGH